MTATGTGRNNGRDSLSAVMRGRTDRKGRVTRRWRKTRRRCAGSPLHRTQRKTDTAVFKDTDLKQPGLDSCRKAALWPSLGKTGQPQNAA
jgi:hypothetical protein